MSLTYTSFVAGIANRMAISSTGPAFQTELPNIIDAAEQECYRVLDLLDSRIVDASASLTASSRTFNLPTSVGRFVVVDEVQVVLLGPPVTVVELVPTSLVSLNNLWPSNTPSSTPSVPEFFAMITSQQILVGPSPDQNYGVVVVGPARPAPLSNTNQTTLLSLYLPDMFFAKAMELAAGYQKNFGAQADDPKMAMSWRQQYETAKASALAEEFRKKFGGSAWSSQMTPTEAQPPRN